ncbi:MAG: PHP domain-containing protein [Planctomycetota bacterium]|nr:PHP domain-containing protein [Planctomycetota bacterium]
MNECITPLHVWSGYSPGRGPCRLGDLIAQARRLGHSRLALTDVNGLYGAPAFARAASDAGITPLIGAQLEHDRHRFIALCDSDAGYANLCRLLSQLHCNADFDLPSSLPSFSDGLQFLLSAPLAACLLASDRLRLRSVPPIQRPAHRPSSRRHPPGRHVRQRSPRRTPPGRGVSSRARGPRPPTVGLPRRRREQPPPRRSLRRVSPPAPPAGFSCVHRPGR